MPMSMHDDQPTDETTPVENTADAVAAPADVSDESPDTDDKDTDLEEEDDEE